jgi:hypothetical protein
LKADVLTTGDLLIGGRIVPGEGARARAVQDLLLAGASPQELADAGVAWVVRESDDEVTVQRIGSPDSAAAAASPHRGLLIAAHVVWLAVLVGGAAGVAVRWRP